jgi:hypothetical protein
MTSYAVCGGSKKELLWSGLIGRLCKSWLWKTGQSDKWIFRLTAASIAAHQERS